ncbi:MAG TPA: citrate lyase holo-[acyl-carrier protein] synthase, partial [Candidatus Izemoplasmatales bacterium]|nr:citrate lyase holo-[acyl-carrier protein] synthase [Candidatus Izemoplasmatales bacterium]
MMIISDKILKAREERSHQISDLLKQNHVVVSIKVNFPGQDKKNPLVYLILNSFSLSLLDLEVKEQILFDSLDGPYYLLLTDQASEYVKKKTVDFESSHGLGRFLDIDVHTKNGDLSRKKKRKCFLCDE